MKNILVIQDISCFGKCSSTVALPILSQFKLTATLLPTAILSTHTGSQFPGYVMTDLREHMKKTMAHWQQLAIRFDALYIGYLGMVEHVAIVEQAVDSLLKPGAKVILDPAFADHGQFYSGLDFSYVNALKRLVRRSDYLLPNYSEACFLLGKSYMDLEYNRHETQVLLKELQGLGTKNSLLTGYHKKNKIGAGLLLEDGQFFLEKSTFYHQHFAGTGDVFASVFVGDLLLSKRPEQALKKAVDFVAAAIQATLEDEDPIDYAVHFEKVLDQLH